MAKKIKTWHYLINLFLKIINYKKMYAIGTYTLNALTQSSADPDILNILNAFSPTFQNFATKYSAWFVARAAKKAATTLFRGYLDGLSAQAEGWDVTIRGFHPRGTSEYEKHMPNNLDPFTQGTIDERILSIKNLDDSIDTTDTDLATVKGNIHTYHTNITNARTDQMAKKDAVKVISGDLKSFMTILAIALFAVLGKLIGKYAADTSKIEHFFDLTKIRHRIKPSGDYDEGLDVDFGLGEIKSIPIEWTGDPLWDIEVNGEGDVAFWKSDNQNPTEVPDQNLLIAAGDFAQKHCSEIPGTGRYLNAANMSQILTTQINIVAVTE